MNKTKLILLFIGLIIIIGCLAGFINHYDPIFLYGSTLGLMAFVIGFYYKDKKVNISSNFIKAMYSVFFLQWVIIIYFISPSTIDDWSTIAAFSMGLIIYFSVKIYSNGVTFLKFFKEE